MPNNFCERFLGPPVLTKEDEEKLEIVVSSNDIIDNMVNKMGEALPDFSAILSNIVKLDIDTRLRKPASNAHPAFVETFIDSTFYGFWFGIGVMELGYLVQSECKTVDEFFDNSLFRGWIPLITPQYIDRYAKLLTCEPAIKLDSDDEVDYLSDFTKRDVEEYLLENPLILSMIDNAALGHYDDQSIAESYDVSLKKQLSALRIRCFINGAFSSIDLFYSLAEEALIQELSVEKNS